MKDTNLSHLDSNGNAKMVDVSAKDQTLRVAKARAIVDVGEEILSLISNNEIVTKKGAVFQTARLAGIMASKKTSELIPLCHPLSLERCDVDIVVEGKDIIIISTVSLTGKTGVEMEALTAVTVAALTLYDMCKAMSHDITIKDIRLLHKTGGKSDYVNPGR